MTALEIQAWLAAMKAAGRAKRLYEAAALLGVTRQALSGWQRDGVTGDAAVRTRLACAALLAGLKPVA